jgi:tRNA (adenine37-N6)-methyltransferase
MDFTFKQIGTIQTKYDTPEEMPIQPKGSDMKGTVILFDEYIEGLDSIDLFSHLILLYCFHQVKDMKLKVKPFLDSQERGVFATRAPLRPNHIGLSVVRLIEVKGNKLFIDNIDVLNGTPLLDIKPYVPKFDIYNDANNGWLPGDVDLKNVKSDTRFRENK